MHDNRRQFIFYFDQGANVFAVFTLNTQPIRENQVGDWNSHSRIFTQVEVGNHLELAFKRYTRNMASRRGQRVCRKLANHRIGKQRAKLACKIYPLTLTVVFRVRVKDVSSVPRPVARDNRDMRAVD